MLAKKPGGDVPADPIIFTKVPESVIAQGEHIVIPKDVSTCSSMVPDFAEKLGQPQPESNLSFELNSASPETIRVRSSGERAASISALWLAVWLAPLLLARQLDVELFGAPLVFWICAQLAPVAFVLLVWRYERLLDRLDRERHEGRSE